VDAASWPPARRLLQRAAQDLADVCLGHFAAKLDELRDLVAREARAAEVDQLALSG
jgi:hypothetical protein